MNARSLLQHRGFLAYWSGVVLSLVGVQATFAANLYHVYSLTGSTAQTGLVGVAQAVALFIVSPLGGVIADGMDRRRLIQTTQLLSAGVSASLALLTFAGRADVWHIAVAVTLNTAASTFDGPARNALIPALVPRRDLPAAFALLTPSRELAILTGPALGGLLIAVGGPGLVYAVDAITYLCLVLLLAVVKVPPMSLSNDGASLWARLREGASFVRRSRIIGQLMVLDVSATLFGAYQVVLPALSTEVLDVGPAGYGLLASAPAAGALLVTLIVFRLLRRVDAGHLVIGGTIAYGLACIALAWSSLFALAILAAMAAGASDAVAASVRSAAVQLETPDALRGRVTALYQMAARGGPAVGYAGVGAFAGLVGPSVALAAGALVPIGLASWLGVRGGRIRGYRLPA